MDSSIAEMQPAAPSDGAQEPMDAPVPDQPTPDSSADPAAAAPPWAHGVVEMVRIEDIVLPRYRARLPSQPRALGPLVGSLRVPGRPLRPLPARRVEGGRFELLEGGRLIEAARILGWTHVCLLVVEVSNTEAVLWTVLSNVHHRRYRRWERIRAVRHLLAVGAGSITGRMIAAWTGWPESAVSECRRASAVLTPEVLMLAGVDEDRDADRLMRLTRDQVRYIRGGETEEEVVVRLVAAINGEAPPNGGGEGDEPAGQMVTITLTADGRWTANVDLAAVPIDQHRQARKRLLREFDAACRRMRHSTPQVGAVLPAEHPESHGLASFSGE